MNWPRPLDWLSVPGRSRRGNRFVDAERLRRELTRDATCWLGLLVLLAAVLLFGAALPAGWGNGLFLVVLGLWLLVNLSAARGARQLAAVSAGVGVSPPAGETLGNDGLTQAPSSQPGGSMVAAPEAPPPPTALEREIDAALSRWPLPWALRILFYHRLAVLRHRQGRFAEASAVCQAILSQPMGKVEHLRGELLLIMAESRLRCGDAWGAYSALMELSRQRLGLMQHLQRLALQTRYEVMTGRFDAALHRLEERVTLAELMPAEQGAAMHAMLATAAGRVGWKSVAEWLGRRAELLGAKGAAVDLRA
ncbi:MAG: hypothetical protein IT442_12850 [Phycisphaeraceae bacterium]|nr:hypothetical protein [Phycisphaeraceae bacterium]